MPVIVVFLLVAAPLATLTTPSPHRHDPSRHRRPIASPSPNPDSAKTLARHASPPGTTSQSTATLIPPHTPALTHPPRTLFSMSERPASHDHLAMWPRTPRYPTPHTSHHTHKQTATSHTPSHPCPKRTHIYQNHKQIHSLEYAHTPKRRFHTHRTPTRHAHPTKRSIQPHTTPTQPPLLPPPSGGGSALVRTA